MIFKKPEKKTAYVQITKKELAMAAIKVVRDNVPESPEMQDALTWAMKVLEDAVPVVRCRECEYWECNPNTKNYGGCKKVSYDDFEVVMERDDFCSYGVRREGGE